MRFHELIEARRNPEQNQKAPVMKQLRKYTDKDVFLSFTADVGVLSANNAGNQKVKKTEDGVRAKGHVHNARGPKIGINPTYGYGTPLGIYAYPVNYVLKNSSAVEVKVPFAGERPYIYVLEPTGKMLDFELYTERDMNEDIEKLKALGYDDEHIIDDGEYNASTDTWAGKMFNITRMFALDKKTAEKSAVQAKMTTRWSRIFSQLGYAGLVDPGYGIIHKNEPNQALFFSKKSFRVVEVIHNTPAPKRTPSLYDIWLKNQNSFFKFLNNRKGNTNETENTQIMDYIGDFRSDDTFLDNLQFNWKNVPTIIQQWLKDSWAVNVIYPYYLPNVSPEEIFAAVAEEPWIMTRFMKPLITRQQYVQLLDTFAKEVLDNSQKTGRFKTLAVECGADFEFDSLKFLKDHSTFIRFFPNVVKTRAISNITNPREYAQMLHSFIHSNTIPELFARELLLRDDEYSWLRSVASVIIDKHDYITLAYFNDILTEYAHISSRSAQIRSKVLGVLRLTYGKDERAEQILQLSRYGLTGTEDA
jgi:hypothetical protein